MALTESFYNEVQENPNTLFDDPEQIEVSEELGIVSEGSDKESLSTTDTHIVDIQTLATQSLARARIASKQPESSQDRSPSSPTMKPAQSGGRRQPPKPGRKKGENPDENLVRLYLQDIGRHPLLTKDDEVRLGRAMEVAAEAANHLNSDQHLSVTTRRQYEALVNEGKQAAKEFVQSNLRLVVSIAKRYQASGLPLLDFIQEGNLGLMHAVEKFDYTKGFKFSTYSTWWIRQAIDRGIDNTGRTIRLPVHAADQVAKLNKARKLLEQEHGRKPTVSELAASLGKKREDIVYLIDLSQHPICKEMY